jgi:sugar lactone lactonase YvrE
MDARRLTAAIVSLVATLTAAWLVGPAAGASSGGDRAPLDVRVFAHVPDPGLPEGIAVARRRHGRRTIYVGTSPKDPGVAGKPPSKLFAYSRRGELKREWTIEGQDLSNPFYGLYGLALDGDGRVYAADAVPSRIVRLDPHTGQQDTYASIPDVPSCTLSGQTGNCSATLGDMKPFPNFPVFAPDGTMYMTDTAQALIWRITPGGGQPEVWLTDPGLESLFGPNGAQLTPDGGTLMFALTTQSSPLANPQRPAGLYTVPIQDDGSPGALELFWESSDAPDGFAIARSGNVYVALSSPFAPGLAVVSPQGEEIARVPENAAANAQLEVPFDAPANVAFLGRRALVTNHAFITRNPQHYAVLDVFAGERGAALFAPSLPG